MPLSALRYGAVFIYNTRRYLLVPLESRDASSQSEKKKKRPINCIHTTDSEWEKFPIIPNARCSRGFRRGIQQQLAFWLIRLTQFANQYYS